MKRYDRQIMLPEMGLAGQQKLLKASVLVVGAGGLGCPVLLYLAAAGVGRIGITDGDVVEESNLQRQVIYQMRDIGLPKAEVTASRLRMLNPELEIVSYPFRLTAENAAELIGRYDLVIDGSDNFPTRYLVNDTCVLLNKTLVFGSVFQFEGQVTVFNYQGSADYRSLYPEPPLADEVPNCGESGVIGTLPGIIGSMMANEAIKVICGFGEVLAGKLLTYNALNNESLLFSFSKSTKKPAEEPAGTQPQKNKPTPSSSLSLDELQQMDERDISYLLIDVREVYEYEEHNIGGMNIPLYDLSQHIPELLPYHTLVFCCSAGTRSRIALNLLKDSFRGNLYTLVVPQAQ
ncbi:molybdopterin/thiamine biosynthesis adenylyltransferase/rhodanese-related sulfurtransferase [Pedobacter africanus]|uniref:Adenylyltransferase/sulfurtransferase n=1 Tax=Pedobacter africanus TaxID=151894 RepID=A0ACC6KRD5_9SPHI|nr:HesA/MoeB/ThiF family protein [Pedobacter africanus]MDR6781782.1 adenylyltransferase/sulfurtransferase [Pedobacter africanus]